VIVRRLVVAAAAIALLVAPVPARASTIYVTITDHAISPTVASVVILSDSAQWTNNGVVPHQVKCLTRYVGNCLMIIAPGNSSGATFDAVGGFRYTVDTHPLSVGTVSALLAVDMASKPLGSVFTLTWSSGGGAPYSYDIQALYPHAKHYATIFGDTPGESGAFLPSRASCMGPPG